MRRQTLLPAILILALAAQLSPGPAAAASPAAPGLSDECPVHAFPSVSADRDNGRYPDPELSVSCTDRHLVIESNGIPPYRFQRTTPNELRAQDYTWRVPLRAELASESTEIPLLGPIAVAVNGLPIYGPNEGPHPDPFGDPVANDILDWCMGHTARQGDYHYHALVMACLTADHVETEVSPVIAFSFDGFPIYGEYGCADAECSSIVRYRSGWQQVADPTTHAWDAYRFRADDDALTLDQCNGHVGPAGDYHYHATETFPYILGCYQGFVDPSSMRSERSGRPGPPGRRR